MTVKKSKALIIYDSLFGNTKKIAEAINDGLSNYYNSNLISVKDIKPGDIESIQLLVIGSPTHGGNYSESVKAFFDTITDTSLKGVKTLAFDTSIPIEGQKRFMRMLIKMLGYAAPRILKRLAKKGASTMGSESFWVLDREGPLKEGETERARKWVADLVR